MALVAATVVAAAAFVTVVAEADTEPYCSHYCCCTDWLCLAILSSRNIDKTLRIREKCYPIVHLIIGKPVPIQKADSWLPGYAGRCWLYWGYCWSLAKSG